MSKSTTSASVKTTTEPFKAFKWHYCEWKPQHSLQATTLDISKGIVVILEILEMGLMDDAEEYTPMLNICARADLMRMAITSASLLAEKASLEIQSENNRPAKGTS